MNYGKEKDKIKQNIYEIQTKHQDKFIVTDKILEYIKQNINIIWDVINNKE